MSSYILIVENEDDIADVMRRYLEFEGYTIICVSNCEAGRAACAAEPPDLIVLDWHLPDMEGDEWIDELRAHSDTAEIPIIMMTGGYPTPALTLRLRAAQIPLLIKPFSLGQLVESIQWMTAREHAIGANLSSTHNLPQTCSACSTTSRSRATSSRSRSRSSQLR